MRLSRHGCLLMCCNSFIRCKSEGCLNAATSDGKGSACPWRPSRSNDGDLIVSRLFLLRYEMPENGRSPNERREAFATLQRVDELVKQVGLQTFAHALMDLPAHRMITAQDAEVQQMADALMEAADWLPFKA